MVAENKRMSKSFEAWILKGATLSLYAGKLENLGQSYNLSYTERVSTAWAPELLTWLQEGFLAGAEEG